jgi:phosphoglucosamine mutase
MISASHNPAHDNGIKIFGADGAKLGAADEAEVARLAVELRPAQPRLPRLRDRSDLLARYEDRLAELLPQLDLTGRTICIDGANGGGALLAPRILRAFGAEVIELACAPDGDNINAGVGALHPELLRAAVMEHRADFGICLDGDGDRGIFVDEQGTVRDGDDVLSLFGRTLRAAGTLPGNLVIATVMSNLGLHRSLREAGVELCVTPVGDRHVYAAMRERGAAIGGEQSGHVLFADHGLIGDGLYTGLRVLALEAPRGIHALFAGFRRYPQQLVNVVVARKPELASVPAISAKIAEVERLLGADGRLLVRYSGTEPKCRVMVEAADAAVCERLCHDVAAVVQRELSA